ncbi:MAG: aspartate dehydrogenase [Candidatus Firestonebacteria bacterium]|nr:aspartate dehydrogenase [Candidatus Firestonebacteria bacterium]
MVVAFVGCGAIGRQLAKALAAGKIPAVRLAGVCDREASRALALAKALKPHPRVLGLTDLARNCDLLIETASMAAVPEVAGAALAQHRDLLVLSVGALIGTTDWFARFAKAGCRLYHPSGAVAGLDGLRAAAVLGGLRQVTLTTRKPPAGLAGAPYFTTRKLNPLTLKRPTVIFSGSARRAVKAFPQNINVAAAVSLAGLGPDKTRVQIIADPAARRNAHTIAARGTFGTLTTTTENFPSEDNPKTSVLAGLSALALIAELARERTR